MKIGDSLMKNHQQQVSFLQKNQSKIEYVVTLYGKTNIKKTGRLTGFLFYVFIPVFLSVQIHFRTKKPIFSELHLYQT